CAEGACVPSCGQCGGLTCASPLACDSATGKCADPSCTTACAAGTHCASGACVDNCAGAMCPGGQTCQGGQCVTPGASKDGGLTWDGGLDASASAHDGPDGGSNQADWQQGPVTTACG